MNKTFLVSVMAILIAFSLQLVAVSSAQDFNGMSLCVEANGVGITQDQVIAAFAGETLPLKVAFVANDTERDVRVKVELLGYRDDISVKSDRFVVLANSIYSQSFAFKMPSDIDPSEDYILRVTVFSQDKQFSADYMVKVQRKSYDVEVMSIDSDNEVEAGANLAVDVVLKNRGFERLDDVYVIARIPELNVEKRAYFEDLMAEDTENDNVDRRDSVERRIFLKLPATAKEGVYDLEVIAYNSDTEAQVVKKISVTSVESISDVLVPTMSREIASGETKTFDLIIVNKGKSLGVYSIIPESAQNLVITVDEPIVTVPADSSKTVTIKVKAGKEEGTYNFAVNVKNGDEVVKRAEFSANVVPTQTGGPISENNLTALTVVLAIIFVVLLIVLIVLLTRKPAKSEELEESYY